MLEKIVGALLGAPAEQVAEYFKEKQKLKFDYKLAKIRARTAAERAKEARAIQADTNDHEWSMLMVQNSGWKDEFVLIVVSTPFILGFIPGMDKYVQSGFDNLANTPVWYQVMIVTIFFAIYGIKKWSTSKTIEGITKR